MRLLLDEMYAPALSRELRRRGHDAVAVTERPELIGSGDRALLEAAARERRAIVTENVRDFVAVAAEFADAKELHFGIVLTSPRRFPRHAGALGVLVEALDRLARANPRGDALRGSVICL